MLPKAGMKIRDVPQIGSVGDTVTYQSRYGLIRRRKVIPHDPRTAPQIDCRIAFQKARAFWGTFTDEQYLAWNNLARSRQTHPLLGESGVLSGYELAVQLNMQLATFDLPMTPNPPPVPIFPDNPVSGLVISGSDGDFSLQLALSAQPVQFIVVLGAKAQNPGVSYVDHYKILGLLPDPEGGLSDITDLYLARFKRLPAGQRVFIRTVQQINGWRDLPQTVSARIPVQ
jgi:hypothetical protein